MSVMRTANWPALTFATGASLLITGLWQVGHPLLPLAELVAMGALVAYAVINTTTWTVPRRWTIAGLLLLAAAFSVADPLADATVGNDDSLMPWLPRELLIVAGGAALAIGLLLRSGLPPHAGPGLPRLVKLLPAAAFTVLTAAAAAKLSETDFLTTASPARTSLLTVTAMTLSAAGLAITAALAGPRRNAAAAIGLLPVLGTLIGALFTIGTTDALNAPVVTDPNFASWAPLQASISPFVLDQVRADRLHGDPGPRAWEPDVMMDQLERAGAEQARTQPPGHFWPVMNHRPVPAAVIVPDDEVVTDPGPWRAAGAALLLAGLASLVTAAFPARPETYLYSYRLSG